VRALRITGGNVFIHLPCRNIEIWDEDRRGPINDEGCDACESAPDGKWRQVYIQDDPS
jgi:hypothetical protein